MLMETFLWSATCHSVSQECNPHASRGSYVRGRYVPPQDLLSMWNAFGRPVWDPYPDSRVSREQPLGKSLTGMPWDPQADGPEPGRRRRLDRRQWALVAVGGAFAALVLLLLLRPRPPPRIEIG